MQLGFIGKRLSGKSTLFELLTHGKYETLHSGMAEYRRGQVRVPDERVDRLSEIYQPKKTTYALFDCIDIAGLSLRPRSDPSGKYLEAVRQTDILLAVLRVFEGYDAEANPVPIDPLADLKQLEEDLILTDLLLVESRLDKVLNLKARSAPQFNPRELSVLEKCKQGLEDNRPLRSLAMTPEENKHIRGFQLLSQKALMAVLNCDEAHYARRAEYEEAFRRTFPAIPFTSVSALAEKEILELETAERAVFMKELGIDESALRRVISTSYEAFGLISFFTVGGDEVRAWPLQRSGTAHEAAGLIHSDIQKGFIRAEVVSSEDYFRTGSMNAAKAKGLLRLEGKEYLVKDGDILNIRFNV